MGWVAQSHHPWCRYYRWCGMPCQSLSRVWLSVPSRLHHMSLRYLYCICTHPSPALGPLIWLLVWAWQSISLIFPDPSMLWCFWGQIILCSWSIRYSHRWGDLHDLIFSRRRRTLGLDARGYWKWGGFGFFGLGSRGRWRPQVIKVPYCERLADIFRPNWVTSFSFGVLNLVGSLLRFLFVENVHNC